MEQTEIKKQLRYFTFPQDVRVRKNKVNQKNFVKFLKQHKKYSNKVIAEKLNVPETMVAHWFREDAHFSIPDPALWFKLKELLEIKTDEYDKSITEFEEREGTYEKRERCYLADFIAPTITTECIDEKIIVKEKKMEKTNEKKEEFNVVVIGQMDNTQDHTFESANRVYDKNQLCPTIPTCAGGNIQPKIIEETKCIGGLNDKQWGKQYHQQDRVYKGDIALAQPANLPEGSYKYIVAMRGRNPERPTDRTPGLHTEQRLEPAPKGVVNTLTTVQKDNLVLEKECIEIKQATKEGSIKCKVGGCFDASYPDSKTRRGRVQEGGDVTPTLTAASSDTINVVETKYRIRKLTPKECWRLMGYTDADFEKAQASGVSNSQLYKQAGNAIVKQVLMAIFSQMGIKGVKAWND